MDLVTDTGHALPPGLHGLDALTPYGTVFCYEDLAAAQRLDRAAAADVVRRLHAHVGQHVR
ncbi:MAG: hypothetical protein KA383_04300 [Phycisphaerae bacterium]|nr:hypothetical protein [Phycisphaerae bacterium]